MPRLVEKSEILNGDSLDILETLPKNFFRLILTDPPYDISQNNNFSTMGRNGIDFGEWDKNFDQITWIKKAVPLLKPGGSIVLFNDWKKFTPIISCLEQLGLKVRRPLIWLKNNAAPFNAKRTFLQSTEFAIWATKKANKKSKVVYNSNYHTGVFKYAIQRSEHPTKKPDGLFSELVEILSNPQEWVLDPFIGSGTTATSCQKLNRNFIGIERDPVFYKLALSNLASLEPSNVRNPS